MSQPNQDTHLAGPPHPAAGDTSHPGPSTPAGHQAGNESGWNPYPPEGPSDAVEYKIPIIRNDKSGLTFTRGMWKAMYRVNGQPRMKSLSTKDLETARIRRDEFYRILGVDVIEKPTERHVYRLCTYQVRVGGSYIGSYKTKREAMQVAAAAVKALRRR